jgi:hypothetical protein
MNETLIVRLAGNRGQIAVRKDPEALLRALNDLDNQAVALLERSQADLRRLLEQMAEQVEAAGEPVKNELVKSSNQSHGGGNVGNDGSIFSGRWSPVRPNRQTHT